MIQETLKEAASKLYPIENKGSMFIPNRHELNNSYKQEGFIEGIKSDAARDYWFSKWQGSRRYNEEELIMAFNEGQALSVRGKLINGKEWHSMQTFSNIFVY
jgi:hypothetical protein